MKFIKYKLLARFVAFFFSILCLFVFVSCGSLNSGKQNVQNYNEIKELISSQNFEIINNWAYPAGGGNINLIGNPNYIRFKEDSVEVYLPYYGVRHSGGGYGRDGGIQFEGIAKNLKVNEYSSKENIMLEFEGEQNSEKLEFMISVYANGSTRTSINSSERSVISYRGTINKIDDN